MITFLNLIALLLISTVVVSFFQNKYIKFVLSLGFALFFLMQVSSLYIGNSFIDYKYYVHFNFNSLKMAGGFKKEIILSVFVFFAIVFGLFLASKIYFSKTKRTDYIIKSAIFAISLLVIVLPTNGMFRKMKEIYDIVTVNPTADNAFNDMAQKWGLTLKEDLEAFCDDKNIIIISLESFEEAFLHDANKDLAPNLRKRKQDWAYYTMRHNTGCGWTAGSLYAVFTGFPSFFAGHPNSYMEKTKYSKLITMGDILQHCNYETYFISDNPTFAGTKDFLSVFNINHIVEPTTQERAPWGGFYDMEIFAEAKNILASNTLNKPFMLWLSTMQTHAPDGFVDERMLQFVKTQKTNLETAAAVTDYLVEDFIVFLQNRNLLENTVVYIFPDHLFMGDTEIFNRTKAERKLWLMTNADKNDLNIDTTSFYQIDILPAILSGAKIKHNVKFLSDFIGKEDKQTFILNNISTITALNSAAIIRENVIGENFEILLQGNKMLGFINQKIFFVENKNQNIILKLDNEFKILSLESVNDEDLKNKSFNDCYSYIKIKTGDNDVIHFDWIKDSINKFNIKSHNRIKLNSNDFVEILKTIFPDNVINGPP